VTATTTTTIRGVSIFSRQRKRKADVFDVALSSEGIAIQRPGRSDQHMTWERISHWEIEERSDCLVLTLRGGGSVTPLQVKGWTLENLETVMRDLTTGRTGTAAGAGAPIVVPDSEPAAPPAVPRTARRRQGARRPGSRLWKPVVAIVLLGILATAVTLVLLQSAGIIDWGFLGPVA